MRKILKRRGLLRPYTWGKNNIQSFHFVSFKHYINYNYILGKNIRTVERLRKKPNLKYNIN